MVNPIFYIQNMRSKAIQDKALTLNLFIQALDIPREPITNRHRISAKYQNILDDYHKIIKEINQSKKLQALMLELIIALLYHVDYSTNPNTNNEIFQFLLKEQI